MPCGSRLLIFLLVACTRALHPPLSSFGKNIHFNMDSSAHPTNVDDYVSKIIEKRVLEAESAPQFYSDTFSSYITGKMMATMSGRPIYAFQGFKYGKAPDATTRFKPPVPAGKYWRGSNFDATHIGFKCPQIAMVGDFPAGEEDCLVLNVYTPNLPSSENKKLPVMFFIHGGGFIMGDSSIYLPTKLLERDVILVTIHYRLGVFGFFSLNNEDAPGNAALYDMIEALRWTEEHIGDFGGDKDRVTIFGESAGSASVDFLMLIPAARGLFHGAIAESGSALDHWAMDDNNPRFGVEYVATQLGCPIHDDKELFHCMANVDVYDLVIAQNKLVDHDLHIGRMGSRGCAPTLQTFKPQNGLELLITKRPMDYYRAGEFAAVPYITGANRDEGSFIFSLMYVDNLVYHNLHKNVTYLREQMVQDLIRGCDIYDPTFSISNSLIEFYCPGIDMADIPVSALCMNDMAGALFMKAGSWQTAKMHTYYSNALAFYYSFELESDDTMFTWLAADAPFQSGVTHSDELMYIFSMPAVMDLQKQINTMNRMVRMWTNLAIYGHPTPAEDREELNRLNIPDWKPVHYDDPHYLLMDEEFTIGGNFPERWRPSLKQPRATKHI